MGLLVKKKKTSKKRRSGGGSGGSSADKSPLRPIHQEKKAPCMNCCPNETSIREIITTIAQTEDAGRTYEESYKQAFDLLTEKNPFPSVCGRVCPHPCESGCNRQFKDDSVSINNIERYVGDWALDKEIEIPKLTDETYDEKIAIIGAGPAGLSAAYQLARNGYENVTVFEAFSKGGGMLRYGIPDYRLPPEILDKEIDRIAKLGVEIKYNTMIGTDMPYEKLQEDFDAIFVGIGAHKGKLLRLENEDAPNVLSGVQFLHRVNSGEKVDVGDKVLVVGGGDTAIDAARIALRLGAEATIVYRRTRTEMPAIEEEIVGAEEENVKIDFLVAPHELVLGDDGRVVKMICQKMELGEPDSSGRRRPVPIDEFVEYECSTVVAAISQEPEFEKGLGDLREGRDWVKVDEKGRSVLGGEKAYAGGDVTDLGLATIAIYQGRQAADTIHRNFRGIEDPEKDDRPIIEKDKIVFDYYANMARQQAQKLAPDERIDDLDKEIEKTITEEQVIEESKRCMSCGSCFDCGTCWSLCQDQAIHKPLEKFQTYTFNLDLCKGCNKCAEACPCGFIEMKNPMTGEIAKRNPETGEVILPA